MVTFDELFSEIVVLVVYFSFPAVHGRECYNYKEEPNVRQCTTGCCGEKYQQYCCKATMQIVGSILGGLFILGAVIALCYYCYRKKSKDRQASGRPGIFRRIGFRSRNNHIHQTNRVPPSVPRGHTPYRIPIGNGSNSTLGNHAYFNPAYTPHQVTRNHSMPFGSHFGHRNAQPLAPTAPLPPPYENVMSSAPPPYSDSKNKQTVPPPPEYYTIAGHTNTLGYKPGNYRDGMPPPSH